MKRQFSTRYCRFNRCWIFIERSLRRFIASSMNQKLSSRNGQYLLAGYRSKLNHGFRMNCVIGISAWFDAWYGLAWIERNQSNGLRNIQRNSVSELLWLRERIHSVSVDTLGLQRGKWSFRNQCLPPKSVVSSTCLKFFVTRLETKLVPEHRSPNNWMNAIICISL